MKQAYSGIKSLHQIAPAFTLAALDNIGLIVQGQKSRGNSILHVISGDHHPQTMCFEHLFLQ